MRHAFLILAYNEFWLLKKLVNFLDNPNCDIYLNIDKRARIPEEDLLYLKSNKAVRRITRHSIHWGGRSMLKCELKMMTLALQEDRADYFHLLSGQDYPIKPLNEFLTFFEREKGKSYISCEKADFQTIWRRLVLFQPLDWYDERSEWGERISMGLLKFQMKTGLIRSIRHLPTTIHVGSQWFSLTKKACNFVIQHTKEHKAFFRRLRHTYVSDEIYINSVLKKFYVEEKVVSNDNLRYIRWKNENGNNPSNLGKEHFAVLASRHEFFARKITHEHGLELVEMIDTFLLSEDSLRKQSCDYNPYLESFVLEILSALKVSSCLVIGNNQLYTQALLGSSMDVNGLYLDSVLGDFLKAIGVDRICQAADFSEPVYMDADERFDILLIINQYHHKGKDKLLNILNSATNLTNKYVLVIEEQPAFNDLLDLESMAIVQRFTTSNELNAIMSERLTYKGNVPQIYLLNKKEKQ